MEAKKIAAQLKSWGDRWGNWVGPNGDESRYKRMAECAYAGSEAVAERDQLRAQLETASNNARHYADKCVELEAHVADLRGALEVIADDGIERSRDTRTLIAQAALARTAAQSLARVKAAALREMARLFMATAKSALSYHNRDLAARFCNAEADRLEASNGR